MIDPVVIRFATQGVQEVRAAFSQVAAQARRFEEQATRASETGTRARTRAAREGVNAQEKEYAKLVKDVDKMERARTKEVEREQKRRDSIVRRSSEMAGREAVKAAGIEAREAKRVAREVEREEERKMRIRIRSSEMAGRLAVKDAAAEVRAREMASKKLNVKGAFGNAIGNARNLISPMGIMSTTLGIGGGIALASAAHKQLSAERTAALLVNAGTSGGVVPGTVNEALAAASAQSRATGIDKNTLMGSALKYAQNARGGDFQGALGNMGFFAKLSKVSGTDINDIAEAAGVLQSQNADLQGTAGIPKMQQMLLNANAQAHAGSMSLVDSAKQIGVLGSTRSSFAGDVGKTQQELIGLGQIARVGGDTGSAGTFIKDIALELGKANNTYSKDRLKAFKEQHHRKPTAEELKSGDFSLVDTDEHGRFKSTDDVIQSVFRKTGGNISQINDLMKGRAGTLFRELHKSYLDGEANGGGVEGGVKSVMENVHNVTGATMSQKELDEQVKVIDSTPAEKFNNALNKLEDTVEGKLEPYMEKLSNKLPELIPKIEKLIDAAGKFAEWLLDNPIKGVGAVIALSISKDIAGAGIGALLKTLLTAGFGGGGGPGGAAGAGGAIATLAGPAFSKEGGKLGMASRLGVAAAGAVVGYSLTAAAIEDARAEETAKIDKADSASTSAVKSAIKLKSGKASAKDITDAHKQAEALTQQLKDQKAAPTMSLMDDVAEVFGQSDLRKTREATQKMQIEETTKALKVLTDALKVAAAAVPTGPPPVTPGSPSAPIPNRSP